jgi:hypothetical protein
MDASISDDPRAPDSDFDNPELDRWRKLGATPAEAAQLGTAGLDSVDDATLIDRLSALRTPDGPEDQAEGQNPPEGTTEAPAANSGELTLLEQRAKADAGEWTPAEPLTVEGVEYPVWDLAYAWVGTRIGDETTGAHLLAPNLEALAESIAIRLAATKPQE